MKHFLIAVGLLTALTACSSSSDVSATETVAAESSVVDAAAVGVTMGPLPAADVLTLRGDVITSVASLGLYDASGSLVRSFATPSSTVTSLPTSGLANGTYRLVMRTAAGELVGSPVVISR
jgi:hypothetical protein